MAAALDLPSASELAESFVDGVATSGVVHWLSAPEGSAQSESYRSVDANDAPLPVILFFSSAERAEAVRCEHFASHEIATMPLFDFLYRWLPGMSADGVLAGLDWREDLCGPERDPLVVREAIDALLPDEVLAAYDAQCGRILARAEAC